MKVLSREFTLREKVLMVFLLLILMGLGYYYFVHIPVRDELERCATEQANLEIELNLVERKLNTLREMSEELEAIEASGDMSVMPSYNASKNEIKLLNDVLSQTEQYSITFSNVSRDGDQIRRSFSVQFTAVDYPTMAKILSGIAKSPYRCMVADIQCSRNSRWYTIDDDAPYIVSATATFYETMVGGTEDAGLPAEKK